MFKALVQGIVDQTVAALAINRGLWAQRSAAAVVMALVLVDRGHIINAAVFIGLSLLNEAILTGLFMAIGRESLAKSAALRVGFWAYHSAAVLIFFIPVVPFVADGSIAVMFSGILWSIGIIVFASNSLASVPTYLVGRLVPAYCAILAVFWVAEQTEFRSSSMTEHGLFLFFFAVYGFIAFRMVNIQTGTSEALGVARGEADARLKALQHLSEHDPLTGLRNRRSFDIRLGELLARPAGKRRVAVYMIDLDGFKPINDTYSHETGDLVLIEVAKRLRLVAGAEGILGRVGGDEFAVAVPHVATERAAYRLGRQINAALNEGMVIDQKHLQVGASVGVSLSKTGNETVSHLCSTADQAMFRAKHSTTRKTYIYRVEAFPVRPTLADRDELLAALQSLSIRPYYQPKVDLETGFTFGFEALARWDHPERGVLPPSEFIPKINQFGLQADFLLHMTRAVLDDVSRLLAEGLHPGEVSVNLPEVTLATLSGRRDLDKLLSAYPDALPCLTLEITEDVFIARSSDRIRSSIDHFRRKGVRVSLDDFGTGFASFQHLGQLNFDELKIDASFMADICTNQTTQVLIGGFLKIAEGLRVKVIAEGVENTEQLDKLRELGCTQAQGYLFGRALPLTESRIRLYAEQGLNRQSAKS